MKPQDVKDWTAETDCRVQRAIDLFYQGYNCAQTVALSLADFYDIEPPLAARMAASFGGGIGRMRETCGAASGMFLMAGFEVTQPSDAPCTTPATSPYPSAEIKKANYAVVQQLAKQFKNECGSMRCADLLALPPATAISPQPEARTKDYYTRRPCVRMVTTGVRIYMEYLKRKYNHQNVQQ